MLIRWFFLEFAWWEFASFYFHCTIRRKGHSLLLYVYICITYLFSLFPSLFEHYLLDITNHVEYIIIHETQNMKKQNIRRIFLNLILSTIAQNSRCSFGIFLIAHLPTDHDSFKYIMKNIVEHSWITKRRIPEKFYSKIKENLSDLLALHSVLEQSLEGWEYLWQFWEW